MPWINYRKPPSAKQVKLASWIADELGLKLPEKRTSQEYYLFTRSNMDRFKRKLAGSRKRK